MPSQTARLQQATGTTCTLSSGLELLPVKAFLRPVPTIQTRLGPSYEPRDGTHCRFLGALKPYATSTVHTQAQFVYDPTLIHLKAERNPPTLGVWGWLSLEPLG